MRNFQRSFVAAVYDRVVCLWLSWVGALAGCSFTGAQLSPEVDGGGRADGGAADSDAEPLPLGRCGTPGVLRGSFAASAAEWALVRADEVELSSKGATLTPGSVAEPTTIFSRKAVDGTDAAAMIEVVRYPGTGEPIEGALQLFGDIDNVVALRFDGDAIVGELRVNGQPMSVGTIPLDRDRHRFLGIREDSGTLYFEASRDGVVAELIGTAPTPGFLPVVNLALTGRRTQVGGGAADFELGSINAKVNPANWCKAETFNDPFDQRGPQWQSVALPNPGERCDGPAIGSGSATVSQVAGVGATNCFIGTAAAFDLTESSAMVEISDIGTFRSTWWTYLEVAARDGRRVQLRFYDDEMCARSLDAQGGVLSSDFDACIAYMGNDHRFWRLRHAGNVLSAEVSANKATWTLVDSGPSPIPLEGVTVRLGTESTSLDTSIDLGISSYNL